MVCYECGYQGRLKPSKIESYQYTESGLDNVYLGQIPAVQCPECRVLIPEIPHPLKLNELLAHAIVSKAFLLSSAEVRFIRTQLGYSQVDFAEKIQRHPSVLNRIERGKEKLSDDLDRIIRMFYLKERMSPKRVYKELDNLITAKSVGKQLYRFHVTKKNWEQDMPLAA